MASTEARASRPSLFLYGAPGCGKSHVGALLRDEFGYTFLEGDAWLPADMTASLARGEGFTPAQRDRFCDVVVAQAMFKRAHRAKLRRAHPWLAFVRVACDDEALRVRRLATRDGATVDAALGAAMARDLEVDAADPVVRADAALRPQLARLCGGARAPDPDS